MRSVSFMTLFFVVGTKLVIFSLSKTKIMAKIQTNFVILQAKAKKR